MKARSPQGETVAAVSVAAPADLFVDDALRSIESRALAYLGAGLAVHLRGPAGAGKTTLAIQIAARIGRPMVFLTGDAWMTSAHLVGREAGSISRQVVDRFVHTVTKIETETSAVWSDNALTRAILDGHTLVYDEFTRSSPAANNPLLSALEERMLILTGRSRGERIVKAHPEFRAILTSNPTDYAGVNAPQDALIDRVVTFDIDGHDRSTEVGIVAMRSGVEAEAAERIVDIVRALRGSRHLGQLPSLRSAIMIAKVAQKQGIAPDAGESSFLQLVLDVLESKLFDRGREARIAFREDVVAAIRKLSRAAAAVRSAA
jgi:gas vesicle protein GvpN